MDNTLQANAEKHSPLREAIFHLKTRVLTGKRMLRNMQNPVQQYTSTGALQEAPVLALSESDLWNPFDNADNWILTAGKVENLRQACRSLHGVEVPAGAVFSFWKHIGRPVKNKGYVVGREIREGCIVPTVAGGLCQLSNALYDASLKAGFEIVERHGHTRVVRGSLAKQGRDATVKWNYVDLRFKAPVAFRIEATLDSRQLTVAFRGHPGTEQPVSDQPQFRTSDVLNDCYSCGNTACFKHPDPHKAPRQTKSTAYLLDDVWPEFNAYVHQCCQPEDHVVLPLHRHPVLRTDRYAWSVPEGIRIHTASRQALQRAIRLRFLPKGQNNVFQRTLELDRTLAHRMARQLPVACTHVVVAQHLLPFVWETGALGGRTFDVLLTRLPFEKLHERLDAAHARYPESPTLNDFRAPEHWISLENQALTKARKVITPHAELAALFLHKAEKIPWNYPRVIKQETRGTHILFPASAVARKGAYELRDLVRELKIPLLVAGSAVEYEGFWEGIPIRPWDGNWDSVRLVVYPTYIDHCPRRILQALARGISVITTHACGLDAHDRLTEVIPGDYEVFREAVIHHLEE